MNAGILDRTNRSLLAALGILMVLACVQPALGQAGTGAAVVIEPNPLPNAAPRRAYRFEFHARNGIPPFQWKVVAGSAPVGLKLGGDGVLTGTPVAAGLYRFTVQATETSNPPQIATREVQLRVVPPLLLEWKKFAKVSDNRIDGSVLVSNGTEDDFDLTVIVLAVADNGRATAIGYQKFSLNRGVTSFEIPFGDTLPSGAYAVHVDAIAEVSDKDLIYRARLQTKEALRVVVGP